MTQKIVKNSLHSRWSGAQRRIGITGGIASGKTSIANFLEKEKQLTVLDADIYSKELLKPGTIWSKKVINRYGKNILISNSCGINIINRAKLGDIIFSTKSEQLWLENLLHPLIKNKLIAEINNHQDLQAIVLVIPLLFELDLSNLCSEIWLIYCDHEQQIERLMLRDKLTENQAEKRIASQWSLNSKKEFADVLINNSGELNEWKEQIKTLFNSAH